MKRKHEQNEGDCHPAVSPQNASCVDCLLNGMELPVTLMKGKTTKTTSVAQPISVFPPYFIFAYGQTGSGLSVFQNNSGKIKGPALPAEQLNFSRPQDRKLFDVGVHMEKMGVDN